MSKDRRQRRQMIKISQKVDGKTMVTAALLHQSGNKQLPEEDRGILGRAFSVFSDGLEAIKVEPAPGGEFNILYKPKEGYEDAVADILQEVKVRLAIAALYGYKVTKPEKVKTVKISGNLVDHLLKTPSKKKAVKDLETNARRKIEEVYKDEPDRTEIEIREGAQLDASEIKLVLALASLLEEKSENTAKVGDDYYIGASEKRLKEAGVNIEKRESYPDGTKANGEIKRVYAPYLFCGITEIARKYSGREVAGTEDIKTVKAILMRLREKEYLVNYKKVRTVYKNGKEAGEDELSVTRYERLIEIEDIGLTQKRKGEPTRVLRETIIKLSPIFRDQIDKKFILIPEDILERVTKINGKKKVPEYIWKVVLYLQREYSMKRMKPNIYADNLDRDYIATESELKTWKGKRIEEKREKALEVCKALGLVKNITRESKNGRTKLTFHLSENWLDIPTA